MLLYLQRVFRVDLKHCPCTTCETGIQRLKEAPHAFAWFMPSLILHTSYSQSEYKLSNNDTL